MPGSGEKAGVEAAVEAFEQVRAESPLLEQAGLFDGLDVGETGALDAPSVFGTLEKVRQGPGRRPGSKNRRTEETTRFLLAQAQHPVLVMMQAYSCTPAEFARKIGLRPGCKVAIGLDGEGATEYRWDPEAYANDLLIEIARLQLAYADKAAPYVAQKLPQAVDLTGAASLTLQFAGVSFPARGAAPGGEGVIEGEAMAVRLPQVGQAKSETDPNV